MKKIEILPLKDDLKSEFFRICFVEFNSSSFDHVKVLPIGSGIELSHTAETAQWLYDYHWCINHLNLTRHKKLLQLLTGDYYSVHYENCPPHYFFG